MIFQGGADLNLKTPNVVIEARPGVSCLAFRSTSAQSPIAIVGNRQQQRLRSPTISTDPKLISLLVAAV